MSIDKLSNRPTQFLRATEGATIQRSALELCEPALHGVEPRGTRQCEVQLYVRVPGKPGCHLRRLVCGAVIENDMQIQRRIRRLVDLTHEVEEFTCPMACRNAPHDVARENVEGGVQARRAVALVVYVRRSTRPGRNGNCGCVRSSA